MALRPILRKLALSLVSMVVAVCLAEVVARLSEPGEFSLWDTHPYLPDAQLDHVHKRNFQGRWDGSWYETNSLGLRGGELRPTLTADEYRVLVLGDSCTFGKGVVEADCWPRQFERMLAERMPSGQRVLVANAGVNGYSPRQYLEVLRQRGGEFKPNLIVIGYNLNDFPNQTKAVDEVVHQGKGNLRAAIPYDLRNFLGRFALFRWLRATYYVMNRERDYAAAELMASKVKDQRQRDPARVAREVQRIDDIAAQANAMGARLCVFLFPYESLVYLDKYDSSAVDWLRGLCEERNIPFVSMVDEFRSLAHSQQPPLQLFLRGDRYHPNTRGYALVAKRVLAVVEAQGWLNKSQ